MFVSLIIISFITLLIISGYLIYRKSFVCLPLTFLFLCVFLLLTIAQLEKSNTLSKVDLLNNSVLTLPPAENSEPMQMLHRLGEIFQNNTYSLQLSFGNIKSNNNDEKIIVEVIGISTNFHSNFYTYCSKYIDKENVKLFFHTDSFTTNLAIHILYTYKHPIQLKKAVLINYKFSYFFTKFLFLKSILPLLLVFSICLIIIYVAGYILALKLKPAAALLIGCSLLLTFIQLDLFSGDNIVQSSWKNATNEKGLIHLSGKVRRNIPVFLKTNTYYLIQWENKLCAEPKNKHARWRLELYNNIYNLRSQETRLKYSNMEPHYTKETLLINSLGIHIGLIGIGPMIYEWQVPVEIKNLTIKEVPKYIVWVKKTTLYLFLVGLGLLIFSYRKIFEKLFSMTEYLFLSSVCIITGVAASYIVFFRPFTFNPDGMSYVGIARLWADGRFYEGVNSSWSFLYPLLMAILYKCGVPILKTYHTIGVGSIVISVIAVFFISKIISDKKSVRWIATLLWATCIPFVTTSLTFVTPDALLTAVISLTILSLIYAITRGSVISGVISGILMGLSYLTKAYALPYFIVIVISILFISVFRKYRYLFRPICFAFIALFLVIAPWITTLSIKYGTFTFMPENYVYNIPSFVRHFRCEPNPYNVVDNNVHKLAYDKAHPKATSFSFTKKNFVSLKKKIQHNIKEIIKYMREYISGFLLLFPFFAIYFYKWAAHRERKWLLVLLLFIFIYYSGYAMLHIRDRYLFPVMPIIFVCIGLALTIIFEFFYNKMPKGLALLLSCIICISIFHKRVVLLKEYRYYFEPSYQTVLYPEIISAFKEIKKPHADFVFNGNWYTGTAIATFGNFQYKGNVGWRKKLGIPVINSNIEVIVVWPSRERGAVAYDPSFTTQEIINSGFKLHKKIVKNDIIEVYVRNNKQ